MVLKFFNPAYQRSLNQYFRLKRFNLFIDLLKQSNVNKKVEILDIGGTESYWENMKFSEVKNVHITLLNLKTFSVRNKNFTSIKGDACNLSIFKDKQFDVVFSNSVIEHLFTFKNQKKMADEVRRVGKAYYIQTPNYFFPLEPHWLFPFFHFLPFEIRVFLTQNFNLGHHKKIREKESAADQVKEVRLLTKKEMSYLFPEGNIFFERAMGMVKSFTFYYFPLAHNSIHQQEKEKTLVSDHV